jgi:CBS-domain-containing membrane protein
MSPSAVTNAIRRQAPLLRADQDLASAVRDILDSGLPGLPVIDEHDRLCGLFGEREFIGALLPGYIGELSYAAFVPSTLDEAIHRRACATEPVRKHMNTEHVEIAPDASDIQIAETFLHHRVLLLPVVADDHVVGIVTRNDFFAALARRLLETHD